MRAEQICFEITETAAIANLPAAQHFIGRVRARGCRFALDDFGSGLSSFGYLKRLQVDFLKIDGTFVREMNANPRDRALVESLNQIGHIFGLRTIAEYVENPRVFEALATIGVDYAQGRHTGEPRPVEELTGG